MIITYDDVRSGIIERTSLKTLDGMFLKNIEDGARCPPFVSNAILESAKRIYNLGNALENGDAIKPGQIQVIGTSSSEPAGKPLKDCKKGLCLVTLNAGQEDQEVLFRDGVAALRRARLLRITEEAHDQGIDLTQEDLAYQIFGSGLRTIRRDIQALRRQGLYVPTRGQQKDVGPGTSHKVLAVKMFLERKTDLEIARAIYHSLRAVERYTVTFARVLLLLEKGLTPLEAAFVVQISERLVNQYRQLLNDYNKPPYQDRIAEILQKVKEESPPVKKKRALLSPEVIGS
jgi:hypothetical protein